MLGYDYEIIYKKWKENVAAYSLSQKYVEEGFFFSLFFIVVDWLTKYSHLFTTSSKISTS